MKKQAVEYNDTSIYWLFNRIIHRNGDLPSYYRFYNKELYAVYYYQYNKRHRTNGPAYINYKRKVKSYYYQGREYASLEQMQMVEACR